MKAYILYWILKSYIGDSAQLSSGAVRVDSLDACERGAAALRELHAPSLPYDKFVYKCELAK